MNTRAELKKEYKTIHDDDEIEVSNKKFHCDKYKKLLKRLDLFIDECE